MATPLPEASLTLLRYRTATPAARARVQLPQHLFTFLLEGEKVVQFAGARVTVRPSHLVLLGAGNCLMSEKAATTRPAVEVARSGQELGGRDCPTLFDALQV